MVEIIGYSDNIAANLSIPQVVKYKGTTYTINSITDFAFEDCNIITSITIPETIKKIGMNAFNGCYNLTTANIPDNIKEVSREIFHSCRNLREVSVSNDATSVGPYFFTNCISLEKFTFPLNIKIISRVFFYGCDNLKQVIIPDGVEKIGEYAFYKCSSLQTIKIPSTVKIIERYAFDLIGFCNIIILGNDLGISPTSFSSVSNIYVKDEYYDNYCKKWSDYKYNIFKLSQLVDYKSKIEIQKKFALDGIEYCITDFNKNYVEIVGYNDELAINIAINSKVNYQGEIYTINSIAEYAFEECLDIERIELPETITEIKQCTFNKCTNLKTIILPKNLKTISFAAFSHCTSLSEIKLLNSLQTIDIQAFNNYHSLQSISIPNQVTKIGRECFVNCVLLKRVTIENNKIVNEIGKNIFGSYISAQIYVPKKLVKKYKTIFGDHVKSIN